MGIKRSEAEIRFRILFLFARLAKKMITESEMFLLDSGAFTFMNSAKTVNIDLKQYIDKYCNFIVENDIKYFFELDIDSVVGYEKVKEFRKYIEDKTKRRSIPVWHRSRGLDEFIRLTEEYDYIAIGGIVTKEIKKKEYPIFTKLIKIAHKNGCKIHGLGFTSLKGIKKYHFDSVDSTSWKSGGRFAQIYTFNSGDMKYVRNNEYRIKYKELDRHNYVEWLKFQKWADTHL